MKNVLLLASTLPHNKKDCKTPPFILDLSKELSKYNEVTILSPYVCKSKLEEKINNNLTIVRYKYWLNHRGNLVGNGAILPKLNKNKSLYLQIPFLILFQFLYIIKIIKKKDIKVIHSHWILPQGLLAVIYKKLLNKDISVVVTSHGGDIYGLSNFNFLKKWVLNNSDCITAVSNAIKKEMENIGVSKKVPIEVLPMGVNFKKFSPQRKSKSIINKYNGTNSLLLFVGRLTEKKGVIYLLRALNILKKDYNSFKLIVVGEGEKKNELKTECKKLGLSKKHVQFVGAIKNDSLPDYYSTADIFIGPSIVASDNDQEGFGLVFVEALSCQCPVIASDLPAIRDIITSHETGILVPPKDSEALSKAIFDLIKNPNEAYKLATKGKKYVKERFSWLSIGKKYSIILNSY
jgi:glycosyltransferase involved in cell wall biosynthesis